MMTLIDFNVKDTIDYYFNSNNYLKKNSLLFCLFLDNFNHPNLNKRKTFAINMSFLTAHHSYVDCSNYLQEILIYLLGEDFEIYNFLYKFDFGHGYNCYSSKDFKRYNFEYVNEFTVAKITEWEF